MDVVVGQELAELVLEKEQVLGAGAHDGVDLVAGLHQRARDGVRDGKANAAANDAGGPGAHDRGLTQRAGDVENGVAGLVRREHLRGLADHHEDELHPALFGVPVRKGERHALTGLVGANHEELASVCVLGHLRRLDAELEHLLRELRLFEDLIHEA